jgi:thiamine monophosphate kinase
MLGGGEDYALVATSEFPIPGFSRIGEVREGRGIFIRSEQGEEELTALPGFDHFR